MTSRTGLTLIAFGLASAGCGFYLPPPQELPPSGTTSGSSSTGGTTGTSGGTTSSTSGGTSGTSGGCDAGPAACGSLGEADCQARPDCQAIYSGDGCVQTFDHCQALQCPALMCPAFPDGSSCKPILDANGCPTCGCQPEGCTSDADCGPDQYCAIPICDPGPDGSTCPSTGTCQPKQICPQVVCAADPTTNTTCTTTTGPDGCPVCTCQTTCSSDADCGAGEKCAPGPNVCACPVDDPTCDCPMSPMTCQPETCSQDSDCKSGESCVIYDCPADMPTCDQVPPGSGEACCVGPQSQCVPTQTACSTDSDCKDGQVCRPEPVFCDCPANDNSCTCGSGSQVCASVSCTSDADCEQGESCGADGLCHAGPVDAGSGASDGGEPTFACGNAQCTGGQVCVFYGGAQNVPVCVDYPQACSTVATCDCLGGAICGANDSAASSDCTGSIPTVSCGYP